MKKIIHSIKQWLISFRKFGSDIVSLFEPKTKVELIFRDPKTNAVLERRVIGRNIVTSFSGASYKSGTDVMRRLLIDPAQAASLNGGNASNKEPAYVRYMELGVGNTPETAADTTLATPLGYTNTANGNAGIANYSSSTITDSRKSVTPTVANNSTDVTFTSTWTAAHLNGKELSEVALITSDPANGTGWHFFARKTFTPFTKTSEFTLEIRWTIRF